MQYSITNIENKNYTRVEVLYEMQIIK